MEEMPSFPAWGREWSFGAMEAAVPVVHEPVRGVAIAPKDMVCGSFALSWGPAGVNFGDTGDFREDSGHSCGIKSL